MKIHRRLIVLVGLGMLLILTLTVYSLGTITTLFSRTIGTTSQISLEVREIWEVEQKLEDARRMVREYVRTGEPRFRKNYETFRDAIDKTLADSDTSHLDKREVRVLASLINDLNTMEGKAEEIFSLDLERREDRDRATAALADIDGLVVWIKHDLERYREENSVQLDTVVRDLGETRTRISVLFGVILFAAIAFLLFFGAYLFQKVAKPLGRLWEGAQAISQGDLDHRVRLQGESDIIMLADRFNDMAAKLKESYADLERRLLERTQQLGALNSVALTLGKSAIMREMLQRSLATVLENFSDMEPRGGIFLCEADGESLRMTVHQGLDPEFVRREEHIRMGECLCGAAAQTGELIFSEQGGSDSRHTRGLSHDHAHIVVPIKSRGIVLGVMFMYPSKRFVIKPSDIQMFDTIGAQLGMAVENLRLYGEVKEAGMKFWDLFENARDILFTIDRSGAITSANRSTELFTGQSKTTLAGRSIFDFLTDEGRVQASRILAGELPLEDRIYEFEVNKPDGTRAFVEISGRGLVQKNRPVGFQVSARDVTEQKSLRELLVQAERLAAIGQIGIAMRHEINNPLTTVIGNTELLLERFGGPEGDLKRRLEMILENAVRIAEILKRLQDIKQDRTIEYVRGMKMTDLGSGSQGS